MSALAVLWSLQPAASAKKHPVVRLPYSLISFALADQFVMLSGIDDRARIRYRDSGHRIVVGGAKSPLVVRARRGNSSLRGNPAAPGPSGALVISSTIRIRCCCKRARAKASLFFSLYRKADHRVTLMVRRGIPEAFGGLGPTG